MLEKYDVLVVGARCAGAATAMLLARRGLRVLAIDRGRYGSDTLSTHALMRGGVMQLARWGVLPRIVAAGTPPVGGATFHYGDEAFEIAVKPAHGVDALYAPRRTVLDAALVDAASAAGAEIRHRQMLVGLRRRTDDRVCGAVLQDSEGQRTEVAADLVVGADGIGSAVARQVEAPVMVTGRHASALIYGHCAGVGLDGYHWFYRDGVSAGAIPTNDGMHCVFAAVPATRFRDTLRGDLDAGYRAVLREVSPDLADRVEAAPPAGRLWAFAGRTGFLRRPAGSGWALVGDAAYFKDPLTAHGITDALIDAELLADAAAADSPEAFEDYIRVRDRLAMPFFTVTDAVASFAWDIGTLKGLHRAINRAMTREVEHVAGRAVALGSDLAAA